MSLRILPVRPKMYRDETAGSLLIRAAQLNGHASVFQLLSGTGFRFHQLSLHAVISDVRRFSQVAAQIGLEDEAAQAALCRTGPTRASPVVLFDRQVPLSLVRDDVTAFCPRCLGQNDYWRKAWIFRPFGACHEHDNLLLDRCVNCGTVPNVGRGVLSQCGSCGASYKTMPVQQIDDTSVKDLFAVLNDEGCLFHAWSFWLALERFDNQGRSPMSDYQRTRVMMRFLANFEGAASWLASAVIANSSVTHPRIQLIDFLMAGGIVAQCASLAIKELSAHSNTGGSEQSKRDLSKNEVCVVLGISFVQLRTLIHKGVIVWPFYGGRLQKISSAEVDRILRQRESGNLSAPPRCNVIIRESHEWADVIAVGERLKVHPDVVRSLIRSSRLPSVSCTINGNRKRVVPLDKLSEFEGEYVLVGTLACEWGVNPTNLREKLQSVGVHAVGGRGIDSVMTSLFRRDSLSHVNGETIKMMAGYPTKTGRRSGDSHRISRNRKTISLTDVAKILQISTQRVVHLVRKGILVESHPIMRPIYVERSSFRKLQKLLVSPEWMRIVDAAEDIGISVTALTKAWIKSGIVKHLDLGPWRLVKKVDVETVKRLRTDYLTRTEAGRELGTDRHYMANLERRGEVEAVRVGKGMGVRLYRKDDIRRGGR